MSTDNGGTFYNALHQLRILAIVSVAYWICISRRRFFQFVLINNFIIVITISLGIFEITLGRFWFDPGITFEPGGVRFRGLTENPNYFSQWLVISLLFYLISIKLYRLERSIFIILVYVLGLALSASLGILVTLLVTLLVVNYRRSGFYLLSPVKITILVVVVIPITLLFVADYHNIRLEIWKTYLNAIRASESLFLGHGGGALLSDYKNFDYYPHSSYIMILFEYGLLGLFLLGTLYYRILGRSRFVPLGQVTVFVVAVYSIFHDLHMTPHFWLALGVVSSLQFCSCRNRPTSLDKTTLNLKGHYESPRVLRRLQPLRRWSY